MFDDDNPMYIIEDVTNMEWLKQIGGLTLWDLVHLGPTLIPTDVLKHQIVTKTLRWLPWIFLQGVNTMVLNDPLPDSYPNNNSETPKFHQNLEMISMKQISSD